MNKRKDTKGGLRLPIRTFPLSAPKENKRFNALNLRGVTRGRLIKRSRKTLWDAALECAACWLVFIYLFIYPPLQAA